MIIENHERGRPTRTTAARTRLHYIPFRLPSAVVSNSLRSVNMANCWQSMVLRHDSSSVNFWIEKGMDAYLHLESGIDAKIVSDSTGMGNIWDVQDDSKIARSCRASKTTSGRFLCTGLSCLSESMHHSQDPSRSQTRQQCLTPTK